jgi:hypothetical protein
MKSQQQGIAAPAAASSSQQQSEGSFSGDVVVDYIFCEGRG